MLDLSVLLTSNVVRVHVQQISREQVPWSVNGYVLRPSLKYFHLSSYNLQAHEKTLRTLSVRFLPDLIHLSLIKI